MSGKGLVGADVLSRGKIFSPQRTQVWDGSYVSFLAQHSNTSFSILVCPSFQISHICHTISNSKDMGSHSGCLT